ncbi:MAG: ABC transporter permease [Corynebacterium sp.]|uniref:ABC transporter permease n=1 Tax=Corynebacterium sp. TaxID=1720 RepID=UPI003F9A0D37
MERTDHPWTGTWYLWRAAIRHDGPSMLVWMAFVLVMTVVPPVVYPLAFPGDADRMQLAGLVESNPALSLILGPSYDLMGTEGFSAWVSLAIGGFLAAMCAIFTTARVTRGQEDSGQAELLASGVVGRDARLLSGVLLSVTGSTVIGVVAGVVGLVAGSGTPALLTGATFIATGWLFTGVTAVAAELASDRHTTTTIAMSVLGVLYVLRGLAYSVEAPEWTVWINPMGWLTETVPSQENLWWPLALVAALTVVLFVIAFRIDARRDFGQGLIAGRPGPEHGRMKGVRALVMRLNRGSVIAWSVTSVLIGFVLGYFSTTAGDMDVSGGTITDAMVGQIDPSALDGDTDPSALLARGMVVGLLAMAGMLMAVPGVQAMVKTAAEEREDRLEPVIAAGADRVRYILANAGVGLLVSAVLHMVSGLVIVGLAVNADLGVEFGSAAGQVAASLPGTLLIVAFAVAVIGVFPKAQFLAWTGVVLAFMTEILGSIMNMPQWLMEIGPYNRVPDVMTGDPSLVPVWVMLVIVAVLVAVGTLGFRNRDLAR